MFNDKSILITGGTGSFGREFVRTILERYTPRRLAVYSRDELKQFEMSQSFQHDCMRYFIGDVRDRDRLVMACKNMDFIIHAAALKQVPAAEYNPMECVKTNVYGAENVVHAALANNVEKVIALSTDKAANPINLYGATKLCSDKIFTAANNLSGPLRTSFSVVRYGNVVGSRGSIVPFYRALLANGATRLPVTHEKMTRFWITLRQGVDFVLNNFRRMRGGEIFVPKIPSIRIVDLVKAMAPDMPYEVIGVRPGEKIHEVMCPSDESHLTLEFHDHYVIRPSITFSMRDNGFSPNNIGEVGKPVPEGFEYSSGNNHWFLSVPEIAKLNGDL